MTAMRGFETDVIIIGGGATGCGILRDCALRGIPAVLVEKDDIASGTTGRNHGLLHSGARYAVKDRESAIECIEENLILRKIVPQVIEPNGGLFVALNDSDIEYAKGWVEGCEACDISYQELTPQQTLAMEPFCNVESQPVEIRIHFACSGRCQASHHPLRSP